jgi:MerR family transcriptional regulator, light-induced transcriptional regulator
MERRAALRRSAGGVDENSTAEVLSGVASCGASKANNAMTSETVMSETATLESVMPETMTLQSAAERLGVHYMTAYRYVRLGLLDASKVKGSWQVSDEAVRLFRSVDGLGPVEAGVSAPWAERLELRLIDGDAQGAWSVIEASMTAGADPRNVYLDLLTPSMTRIGSKWAAGDLDIAVEHRASVIAMRIVGRLGPRFVRRGRPCGEMIVGAAPGESHALATAILSDLMRLHGWNVVDLGADTPAASFLHALHGAPETRAVGISVTHSRRTGALGECCVAIKQEFPDVVVVVGGQGLESDEQAVALGADARATSADHFHELVRTRPVTAAAR